ncbi:hypothetical protein DPMN_128718 [Dreissena polymorpha]|uniref:Uncharacterized protein n=1 Tax=Dreissena polymorpha TaxID=45954 RepID=A0A9D4JWQ6_DREPO|nr:hypothetical protein DPMN_128718 [Dreissena polymorpha]
MRLKLASGIAEAVTYFTIIVQRNPLYQKGGDLQESLLCIYDLGDISVGNGINVGYETKMTTAESTRRPRQRRACIFAKTEVTWPEVLSNSQTCCAVDIELFPNFVRVNLGVLRAMFPAFRSTELSGGLGFMMFTRTL